MNRPKQNGAALIVVLLLVATLSFILMSVTGIVTASVKRAGSERTRSELLWRAFGAEEIAKQILLNAARSAKMTRNDGIFREPVELPFEKGAGQIAFFDATRCFNVNSAASSAIGSGGPADQFVELLQALGLRGGEANKVVAVVTDFIDAQIDVQPQGAEDGFYTLLPTPFRTAEGPVASVSELRAMDGVTADIYRRIRPFLCAREGAAQPAVNINMLLPDHAPLVFALAGATTPIETLRDEISRIPPGGHDAVPTGLQIIPGAAVRSEMIEARVRLELNGRSMEEIVLFKLPPSAAGASGKVKLIARSFGDDI